MSDLGQRVARLEQKAGVLTSRECHCKGAGTGVGPAVVELEHEGDVIPEFGPCACCGGERLVVVVQYVATPRMEATEP